MIRCFETAKYAEYFTDFTVRKFLFYVSEFFGGSWRFPVKSNRKLFKTLNLRKNEL